MQKSHTVNTEHNFSFTFHIVSKYIALLNNRLHFIWSFYTLCRVKSTFGIELPRSSSGFPFLISCPICTRTATLFAVLMHSLRSNWFYALLTLQMQQFWTYWITHLISSISRGECLYIKNQALEYKYPNAQFYVHMFYTASFFPPQNKTQTNCNWPGKQTRLVSTLWEAAPHFGKSRGTDVLYLPC